MNKKIITVVSLVLALVFVTALTLIFANINSLGQEASSDITNVSKSMNNMKLERFNQTYVDGDTVRYVIDNMAEMPDGMKMSFLVRNDLGEVSSADEYEAYGYCAIEYNVSSKKAVYNGVYSSVPVKSSNVGDIYKQSARYIHPDYKYLSTLVKDSRGKVVGISFSRWAN